MNTFSQEFNSIKGWQKSLPCMTALLDNIEKNVRDITADNLILPSSNMIFNAFKHSTYEDISAVIIGQDPYHQTVDMNGHTVNQAMGLAFSVPEGVKSLLH
ncbi:hypothetical protein [Psychromonas sp. MME2]|uniref:hypothetical protein n=1 Tax=unclassified Psychromonas TaxID=2614957 RepID=UPI00339C2DA9